jgi:hypothetical protein
MRSTLITIGLALAIYIGFAAQDFIPPLWIASGARVYLAPVFFCYGACTLPFPSMIVLALIGGFLSDFTTLQIVERSAAVADFDAVHNVLASVEISAGWSILLFVAIGSICQGFRPLVLRGHFWIPVLMSALLTVVQLGLQFAVITIRRFEEDGFFWSETVLWRILAPGLVAMLLTLALVLVATLADHLIPGDRRALREY